MTSFSSFAALPSVGGNLIIAHNDLLATVSGFDQLGTIMGSLSIGDLDSGEGNPVLTTAPPFIALTTINGNLDFVGNDKLTDLPPFALLAGIEASLSIVDNAALTTLPLIALTSIGGALHIADNDNLACIPGCRRAEYLVPLRLGVQLPLLWAIRF